MVAPDGQADEAAVGLGADGDVEAALPQAPAQGGCVEAPFKGHRTTVVPAGQPCWLPNPGAMTSPPMPTCLHHSLLSHLRLSLRLRRSRHLCRLLRKSQQQPGCAADGHELPERSRQGGRTASVGDQQQPRAQGRLDSSRFAPGSSNSSSSHNASQPRRQAPRGNPDLKERMQSIKLEEGGKGGEGQIRGRFLHFTPQHLTHSTTPAPAPQHLTHSTSPTALHTSASFAHALRHDSACDLRQEFTARKTLGVGSCWSLPLQQWGWGEGRRQGGGRAGGGAGVWASSR